MPRILIALALTVGVLVALAPASMAQPAPPATSPPPTSPPTATAPTPPTATPPDSAPGTTPPAATPPTDDAPPSEETKQEARLHFDKGINLLREKAWAAALAEFLLSRKLYPTRAATNNAAIALRELQRFDESLDMFETLLRDFPNIPPTERATAQRAVAELRGRVGTLDVEGAEPGAAIVVSGQNRGEYPPVTPIRITAGTHLVRVFKEGFEPYETRVDVAGGQTARVTAKLRVLTESGSLRVTEQSGKTVDVLVDNVVVGQTPWQGVLAIGDHMVALRGEGKLGTQPAAAPVKPQKLTSLSLLAEDLEATLRVDPTPPGASVWINSVNVGRGVWLGRLKTGKHQVEVKSEGFVPAVRAVVLERGQREVVALQLDRDDDAEIWRKPSKFTVEVSTSFVIAPTFGGDVAGNCTGDCARSVGIGGLGLIHAGYEFGSGFGIGIEAGYLVAAQDVEGRAAELLPNGLTMPAAGMANDNLRLSGFMGGATGGIHLGERFPALLRLGAGVLVGQLRVERNGMFRTSVDSTSFEANPISDFPSATYFYLDPEARVGVRFAEHFEVSATVQVLMLIALDQPKWNKQTELAASSDGIATYPEDQLMGSFVVMVAPGLNLRYAF